MLNIIKRNHNKRLESNNHEPKWRLKQKIKSSQVYIRIRNDAEQGQYPYNNVDEIMSKLIHLYV